MQANQASRWCNQCTSIGIVTIGGSSKPVGSFCNLPIMVCRFNQEFGPLAAKQRGDLLTRIGGQRCPFEQCRYALRRFSRVEVGLAINSAEQGERLAPVAIPASLLNEVVAGNKEHAQ